MTLLAPPGRVRAPEPEGPRAIRGDIQGLRAVSVLLVIVAHAGFTSVAGGYIGVDVFFVISGFLITTLLLREVVGTERLSLVGFYARRARRILPAATLVLVATCVATALFLPVVRADEIFVDAIWAGLFASNVRFAMVETDYFATGPVSPLQHYWSLSVEEQFYVVWPLLLLLVLAAGRFLPARYGVRLRAGVALGALVVASLAWSVWATWASPDTAYFSTFTRIWELGAGALLALVLLRPRGTGEPGRTRPGVPTQVLALAGIVAILVGALAFDASTPFPGLHAAVPVLGAVAVLTAGGLPGGQHTVVGRLLSLRPAQVIGDWSYSLYLWHFPVLVIGRSYLGGLSRIELLACLVAIFVLSALTFYLVEQPFRRGRAWRRPRIAVVLYPASVGVLAVGLIASTAWVDHRAERHAGNPPIALADYRDRGLSDDPARALVEASLLAAEDGEKVPGGLVPDLRDIREDTAGLGACDYRTGTRRLCPGGDADAERSIVLIGDSHARAWSPTVSALAAEHGYRSYAFVYTGCPANQAYRLDPETGRRWAACEDFVEWSIDTIGELRPELVLIANAPLAPVVDVQSGEVVGKADNRAAFTEAVGAGLRAQIDRISPYAGRVGVLANTPKLPHEPGLCLAQADLLSECVYAPSPGAREIERSFAAVAEGAGAAYVDAERWFCVDGRCPPVIGPYVAMRDTEHMTTAYAVRLAGPLAAALAASWGISHL